MRRFRSLLAGFEAVLDGHLHERVRAGSRELQCCILVEASCCATTALSMPALISDSLSGRTSGRSATPYDSLPGSAVAAKRPFPPSEARRRCAPGRWR